MDLISHAIRTIFYDVNVGCVANDVIKRKCTFLEEEFVSQTIWQAKSFTRTEIKALRNLVLQQMNSFKTSKSKTSWSLCFHLLNQFSNRCLKADPDQTEVRVKFSSIQQWREISLLLGEDILTTSFLAKETSRKLSLFDWPNIIHHNNPLLNNILEDGLIDIHAHLKASADIFELTWLDFMNNVSNRSDDYSVLAHSAEAYVRTMDLQVSVEVKAMIQVAALLRCLIFESLKAGHPVADLYALPKLLFNEKRRVASLVPMQARIDRMKKMAVKSNVFHYPIDYAITTTASDSIYAIHEGERSLLYDFFTRFYKNDASAKAIGDYMFLYLLLKIRIRKEFIQTNPLSGFENFKIYEGRKSKYSNIYSQLYQRYAIQSSIRPGSNDKFETRVTPIEIPECKFDESILGSSKPYSNIDRSSLTFVIHFIKNDGCTVWTSNNPSRIGYRDKIRSQVSQVLDDAKKRLSAKFPSKEIYDIVGIDAAGSELHCSPSVFGQAFRYARLCGFSNLTYHVGEDFYDLIDGLFAIDEAISFLDLRKDSRLGHAIALGVNAHEYYRKRHYEVVMTRQRLLDNIVWLIKNADNNIMPVAFRDELMKKAIELYQQIGFKQPFDVDIVYYSQRLRSDDCSPQRSLSNWNKAALCLHVESVIARNIPLAVNINRDYQLNQIIKDKGNEITTYSYAECIADIVTSIQKDMRNRIFASGITIETNPSSNLKIGPIDCYEDEPLFAFIDTGITSTVNTDDKGIFSTSLYNEFSLIASACLNRGMSSYRTYQLIQELKNNAVQSRFKVSELKLN